MLSTIISVCNSRTKLERLNYGALGNGMKANLTSQAYNFQETWDCKCVWRVRCYRNHEKLFRCKLKVANPHCIFTEFKLSRVRLFAFSLMMIHFFCIWINFNSCCSDELRGILCQVLSLCDAVRNNCMLEFSCVQHNTSRWSKSGQVNVFELNRIWINFIKWCLNDEKLNTEPKTIHFSPGQYIVWKQ